MRTKHMATLQALALLVFAGACGVEDAEPGVEGEAPEGEVDIDRDALVGDVFPGIALMNLGSWECARTDEPTSSLPRVDSCPSVTPPSGITLHQPNRRWTFEVVDSVTWVDNRFNVYTIRNDETGLCLTRSTLARLGQPFDVYESACPTGAAPSIQRFAYVPSQYAFAAPDNFSIRLRQVLGQDSLEMGPHSASNLFQYWHLYL